MKTTGKNSKNTEREEKKNSSKQATANDKKFPESTLTKNPRKDSEIKQEDSTLDDLATETRGSVGSRTTGKSADDIAGIADINDGMRRAEKS